MQFIESAIKESEPDVIITHHPADTNNDHLQTSMACQEAIRLFQRRPEVKRVKEFWYMEVPSCTEWKINNALQEFCRMSGVSYQKYLEWEHNQALGDSQKKLKSVSEPPVGIVTIPDAPSTEQPSKKQGRPIRDLNVRLANGTYVSMHHVGLEDIGQGLKTINSGK